MRIALVGTVISTQVALEGIIENGVKPQVVVTLDPTLRTRHSDYVDLAWLTSKNGIETLYVKNINDQEVVEKLEKLNLDYIFVIGWSQILRPEVLGIARFGVIGYHPALLPNFRGRGVIPWTIIKGLSHTGGTLFFIDEGLDSGDIIIQREFELSVDETASSLVEKHMKHLKIMIAKLLDYIKHGQIPRIAQDETQASFCARRTPRDGLIDWNRSAYDIWTLIRATTDPYPGAFTFWNGKKLIIWKARLLENCSKYIGFPGQIQECLENSVIVQCGDGKNIELLEVQIEGEERCNPLFLKKHERLGISMLDLMTKGGRK